jgi:hypothetical protein
MEQSQPIISEQPEGGEQENKEKEEDHVDAPNETQRTEE